MLVNLQKGITTRRLTNPNRDPRNRNQSHRFLRFPLQRRQSWFPRRRWRWKDCPDLGANLQHRLRVRWDPGTHRRRRMDMRRKRFPPGNERTRRHRKDSHGSRLDERIVRSMDVRRLHRLHYCRTSLRRRRLGRVLPYRQYPLPHLSRPRSPSLLRLHVTSCRPLVNSGNRNGVTVRMDHTDEKRPRHSNLGYSRVS